MPKPRLPEPPPPVGGAVSLRSDRADGVAWRRSGHRATVNARRAAGGDPPSSICVEAGQSVSEPVLQVFRLCGKFPRKTEALTRHFAFAAKRDDEARRSADEKPLVAHCHACHRVEKLAEPASFSTFRVRPYQWQTTTSPDWMMPKRSAADPTGRFTQPWLPRPCWYNVPPNAACQSASCRPMTLPTNGIQ